MTKADLLKRLESFPDDTVVVTAIGSNKQFNTPVIGYETIQPIHVARNFPFYTPESYKQQMLDKTVIVIS